MKPQQAAPFQITPQAPLPPGWTAWSNGAFCSPQGHTQFHHPSGGIGSPGMMQGYPNQGMMQQGQMPGQYVNQGGLPGQYLNMGMPPQGQMPGQYQGMMGNPTQPGVLVQETHVVAHHVHMAPTSDWSVGQKGDKKIWIHKSGQVRENEPPAMPQGWTMEWNQHTKRFFYVCQNSGIHSDTLPPGAIRAEAPKKKGAVKKMPKSPPTKAELNAAGVRKATSNCKRFAKKLDVLRTKFSGWLYPTSKNKSLALKLAIKNNPNKAKMIRLGKNEKAQCQKELALMIKDFKQFLQDWNITGPKAFSDRDFQAIMLSLGNFKEELAIFNERLVKSETTHTYISDLQNLLSKINIQSDQTLNYNNSGSLSVDIDREDELKDHSTNFTDAEEYELEDPEQEEVADGAGDDGW